MKLSSKILERGRGEEGYSGSATASPKLRPGPARAFPAPPSPRPRRPQPQLAPRAPPTFRCSFWRRRETSRGNRPGSTALSSDTALRMLGERREGGQRGPGPAAPRHRGGICSTRPRPARLGGAARPGGSGAAGAPVPVALRHDGRRHGCGLGPPPTAAWPGQELPCRSRREQREPAGSGNELGGERHLGLPCSSPSSGTTMSVRL